MSTTYGAQDWERPLHRQAPYPASSMHAGVRHLYFEDAEIGTVCHQRREIDKKPPV
jgi:hypothetical protein